MFNPIEIKTLLTLSWSKKTNHELVSPARFEILSLKLLAELGNLAKHLETDQQNPLNMASIPPSAYLKLIVELGDRCDRWFKKNQGIGQGTALLTLASQDYDYPCLLAESIQVAASIQSALEDSLATLPAYKAESFRQSITDDFQINKEEIDPDIINRLSWMYNGVSVLIAQERLKQDKAHGKIPRGLDPFIWLLVILEEVGEMIAHLLTTNNFWLQFPFAANPCYELLLHAIDIEKLARCQLKHYSQYLQQAGGDDGKVKISQIKESNIKDYFNSLMRCYNIAIALASYVQQAKSKIKSRS